MRFDLCDELFQIVIKVVDRVFFDLSRALAQCFPIGNRSNCFASSLDEGGRRSFERALKNSVLESGVRSLGKIGIRKTHIVDVRFRVGLPPAWSGISPTLNKMRSVPSLLRQQFRQVHRLHRRAGATQAAGDLHQTTRIVSDDIFDAAIFDPCQLLLQDRV